MSETRKLFESFNRYRNIEKPKKTLKESENTRYKDFTDKDEVTEEEYNLFKDVWEDFWNNQSKVYNTMADSSDNKNGAFNSLLDTEWAKNVKEKYNLNDYDFKSLMWSIYLGWESNSIKWINESANNRFSKKGYNFVQYDYRNEEDAKTLEELNNEPEVIVYDVLYSDKNGINPDDGKNYFDKYGCEIIYISEPLKGPDGPQEYMRAIIYKGTPEQVALFRTGGTGHTLKDAAEVDDICIATPKRLTESANNDYDIELFMNTWGNYNENGADADSIGGGWMSVEQAKEFIEKHNSEEPFINDTNNCPIEVDEYDNPMEVIEQLEFIESLSQDDVEAFIAITESNSNDFEDNKRIFESGDFTFFAGVDNDEDLGRHYVDMVGGLEGVSNIEYYIDEDAYRESWREAAEQSVREENPDLDEDSEEFEEKVDKWLDAVASEQLEIAKADGADLSEYFDYEAFGRDLEFEGYFFASTGAIQTL